MIAAEARRPTGAMSALDLYAAVGRDHAIAVEELGALSADGAAGVTETWAVYQRHWRGFCGSRLDPQFCQLDHPARRTGGVRATGGAPIVVVGTGPSLVAAMPSLRRVRPALHLITSLRGADALAAGGIVPDLILIQHQTALDAHFSLADRQHGPSPALTCAPLVAAETRTPAALLAGVAEEQLFVPDPCPTWGLWPATAVSLALAAGAGSVGLVGIDLGRAESPDPLQAPLMDLLGLLARQTRVPCLDLGAGGAPKAHWSVGTLEALATGDTVAPLSLEARRWLTADARRAHLSGVRQRLADLAADAALALEAACVVRDTDASPRAQGRMVDAFERLLAAGTIRETRIDAQDGLGVSFLPRFWRTPPDPALGARLWRAVALASHELVQQYRALEQRLEGAR